MSKKEKAKNSESFCLLPFIHMATKTDGDLKLCCRSWPIGNVNQTSIKELWNSDTYKRIRKQMLEGERPNECHACWRHEDIGVRSMRERYNHSRWEEYSDYIEKINDDYSMPFDIPVIEAKLSNFCNLKCRMCHPLDSTSWSKDWKAIEHLMEDANKSTYEKVREYDLTNKPYMSAFNDNEKFWEDLRELAPYLKRIEFAGGEPLIDPLHYRVLHFLKDYGENIQLKYSTNLTKLNYKKDDINKLWNHFRDVDINISIDGVHDVYNYIRQLSDYEIVKENIKKVNQHPKVTVVVAAVTLQIYNIFSLPEMFDEFVEELNILVHTHRVNYPKFLDVRVIPNNLKFELVEELRGYINNIDNKTHKNWTKSRKNNAKFHINDAINSLLGGDMQEQITNFVKYSDILDEKQNVSKTWRELLPRLAGEIDEY